MQNCNKFICMNHIANTSIENNNNEIIDEENVQKSSESEFQNMLNLLKKICAQMLSSSKNENESIL
ncbi:hypothetical protein V1478_011681 [Vespula squamosa]|uniref:Uncharacterized protein n=1 Tax=Vespula squamosa TaxID=30214 RepID=A0ABD2AF68_VESSQ